MPVFDNATYIFSLILSLPCSMSQLLKEEEREWEGIIPWQVDVSGLLVKTASYALKSISLLSIHFIQCLLKANLKINPKTPPLQAGTGVITQGNFFSRYCLGPWAGCPQSILFLSSWLPIEPASRGLVEGALRPLVKELYCKVEENSFIPALSMGLDPWSPFLVKVP